MTAGMAVEMADGMRPNNDFDDRLKQNWLRECDARLRKTVVERSSCGDFDAMGADVNWWDGLEYDTELMVPEPLRGAFTRTGCAHRWIWRWARRRGLPTRCSCMRTRCRSLRRGCGAPYAPAGGAQWRY